jgi:hypothetical protein
MVQIDDSFQLEYDFPPEFQINFKQFEKNFSVKFIKISKSDPIHQTNVYVIDGLSGDPIKYDSIYKEVNEFYFFNLFIQNIKAQCPLTEAFFII